MSAAVSAIDAAIAWVVPVACSALLGWAVLKRKAIAAWRAQRREYTEQIRAMAANYPGFEARIDKHFNEVDSARIRTTAQFKAISDRLDAQDKVLSTMLSMTTGQFEMLATASFICDAEGRNTHVNAAYATLLGVGRDDLMDYRYRSRIPQELVAAHVALFNEATAEHREYETEIVMLRGDRTPLHLRVHMIPYPRETGPATGWWGTVTVVPGMQV